MLIFVFATTDGYVVVGESTMGGRAITEYNTVYPYTVDKVIGVKRKTKKRTVESVSKIFSDAGHKVRIYKTKYQQARLKRSRALDKAINEAVEEKV